MGGGGTRPLPGQCLRKRLLRVRGKAFFGWDFSSWRTPWMMGSTTRASVVPPGRKLLLRLQGFGARSVPAVRAAVLPGCARVNVRSTAGQPGQHKGVRPRSGRCVSAAARPLGFAPNFAPVVALPDGGAPWQWDWPVLFGGDGGLFPSSPLIPVCVSRALSCETPSSCRAGDWKLLIAPCQTDFSINEFAGTLLLLPVRGGKGPYFKWEKS